MSVDLFVIVTLDVVTHRLRKIQVDPADLLQEEVVADHLVSQGQCQQGYGCQPRSMLTKVNVDQGQCQPMSMSTKVNVNKGIVVVPREVRMKRNEDILQAQCRPAGDATGCSCLDRLRPPPPPQVVRWVVSLCEGDGIFGCHRFDYLLRHLPHPHPGRQVASLCE